MNIHPEFPESRLNHPSRQAELDVYLEVHATDMARPNRACREAEFPICLQDVARIAMQVKGGKYRI